MAAATVTILVYGDVLASFLFAIVFACQAAAMVAILVVYVVAVSGLVENGFERVSEERYS